MTAITVLKKDCKHLSNPLVLELKTPILKVMKLFDIYAHPQFGLTTVKRGFSWSAFIAPSIWASFKGLGFITLFLVFATTLSFNIASFTLHWYSGAGISPILLFPALLSILGLVAGVKGHIWHADSLRKDGFEKKCSIVALNSKHAKRAFKKDEFISTASIAA